MNGLTVDQNLSEPGLDYDFLRYVDVRAEEQRRIQSFYLPYFEPSKHVVDLACGDGDFVALLHERSISVVGVDSDEKAAESAKAKGLPFIHQDVFTYLTTQPDASVDGIFCAHLVEHLPYPQVIELIKQSYRILQPGGRAIFATPNVRSLFSHLEMFYMHFGHVSFYHPRLLCFFLEHEGFVEAKEGVNPNTSSILMQELLNFLEKDKTTPEITIAPSHFNLKYRSEIPLQGNSLLHRLSYNVKRWFVHMFVQPLVDDLALNIEQVVNQANNNLIQELRSVSTTLTNLQREQRSDLQSIAKSLQSLNGPFECFSTAIKPVR